MTGVYLTLNQGVTLPSQRLGRSAARSALRGRADAIRMRFPELVHLGFDVAQDMNIDLRAPGHLAAGYREPAIASQFFAKAEVAPGEELYRALANAVAVYEKYLGSPIVLELPQRLYRP